MNGLNQRRKEKRQKRNNTKQVSYKYLEQATSSHMHKLCRWSCIYVNVCEQKRGEKDIHVMLKTQAHS